MRWTGNYDREAGHLHLTDSEGSSNAIAMVQRAILVSERFQFRFREVNDSAPINVMYTIEMSVPVVAQSMIAQLRTRRYSIYLLISRSRPRRPIEWPHAYVEFSVVRLWPAFSLCVQCIHHKSPIINAHLCAFWAARGSLKTTENRIKPTPSKDIKIEYIICSLASAHQYVANACDNGAFVRLLWWVARNSNDYLALASDSVFCVCMCVCVHFHSHNSNNKI